MKLYFETLKQKLIHTELTLKSLKKIKKNSLIKTP